MASLLLIANGRLERVRFFGIHDKIIYEVFHFLAKRSVFTVKSKFIAADYLDEIVSNKSREGDEMIVDGFEVSTSDIIEHELRSEAFTRRSAVEAGASVLLNPSGDRSDAFVYVLDVYEKIDDLNENPGDVLDGHIEVVWEYDVRSIYKDYPVEINDYFEARVANDRYPSLPDAIRSLTRSDDGDEGAVLFEQIDGLGNFDRLIDAIRFCANLFAEERATELFEAATRSSADELADVTGF